MLAMPPRSSLTGSFSVSDANNEVVCPLLNNDGSNCRKRCLGVSFLDLIFSLFFDDDKRGAVISLCYVPHHCAPEATELPVSSMLTVISPMP